IKGEDKIISWYREVVERTARLMAEWQRVGFVHGVMNTDNMSILGLTIDYGPYSFVDNYDPLFTPNTTDLPGRRYAFSRQAPVAKWNLGALGGAIVPLLNSEEELMTVIDGYDDAYWNAFYGMMANKLGLDEIRKEDVTLISDLEKLLATLQPDMTIFYQLLITVPQDEAKESIVDHFAESFYQQPSSAEADNFYQWVQAYKKRRFNSTIPAEESVRRMQTANPRFILRNYLLHQAIEELEKGDDTLFAKLQQAMKEPYSSNHDQFFQKRPEWATEKAGCSMLSCSS
ncbi:MAG TPA: protein adenylyltransferase SelO family protein, partial [Flavisolibacter sp.]|nr:protein adenylyltransferase SelO family protein [Flavisolibacter sp.]